MNDTVFSTQYLFATRRDRECRVGVAALSTDHLLVNLVTRSVVKFGFGVHVDADELNHDSRQGERQLSHVTRSVALKYVHGFIDLERVADGATEWRVHRRELRNGRHAMAETQTDHRRREFTSLLYALDEGAASDFHVQYQSVRSLGDLLGHDRRRNERNRCHGRGHVAQRIELPIDRGQSLTRGTDDRAHRIELLADLVIRQEGAPPGDRLEFVKRPSRVSETATGKLRNGGAARRHEWREDQGDLVTHAAG